MVIDGIVIETLFLKHIYYTHVINPVSLFRLY